MHIIYFCGDDKAGKTTMAKSLQKIFELRYNIKIPILSFSAGLRYELIHLYGLPNDIINNRFIDKNNVIFELGAFKFDKDIPELWVRFKLINNVEEYKNVQISLRDLLVTHGTKIRRQQDDLYWFEQVKTSIKKLYGDRQYIIIDDPRSPSDFTLTKKPFIFHLNNGNKTEKNLEQSRFQKWIKENEALVTEKINVPIPLSQYSAYSLNLQHVIPNVMV